MDDVELRAFFGVRGPEWIRQQARFGLVHGAILAPDQIRYLEPFAGDLVRDIRLLLSVIQNPPWYPDLLERGLSRDELLDFTRMDAITFDATIIFQPQVPMSIPGLFHELVHVVQYRMFGVDDFARRYLDGWLAGRPLASNPVQRYMNVPLERQAYALQARFLSLPQRSSFSIEEEVRAALDVRAI
jgi:hypothetical protein